MICPLTEIELDELLSRPNDISLEAAGTLGGDLLVLGAGGKMGPSLCVLARRSFDAVGSHAKVIAVSRFSDPLQLQYLQQNGVETVSVDLLQPGALDTLPNCPNVIYLPGMKFGSQNDPGRTWAMNVYLAGLAVTRFRNSRFVALSSGNVYSWVSVKSGGSKEIDVPQPHEEYALTCLGRERMFHWGASQFETASSIVRLNYATDLRYGVLVDIASNIIKAEPIDVAMSIFNTVWQGYANSVCLALLSRATVPPFILNLTGSEIVNTRQTGYRLGELLGKAPVFIGGESGGALISDASKCFELFGKPDIGVETLIEWTATWMMNNGRLLDKPTHFDARNGRF